ncbi:AraC family transcriptional regulator [Maribacter vaceletii]|uniref:AraC family transcriptional regulator n=1 Tax=Maribacter vaceletii TaxID=1206816 RepID=A0A495E8N1_9FLAO|nr:helix-turn-helix transcriptional regulator [Maribacter vaceletii]RKR13011.1 AraC family transcriptional regulator [Maribacter vaceletii]
MKNEIPKVSFDEEHKLRIEVMDFKQLLVKLKNSQINHNPFEPHKIEFYVIIIVTKNTYTHFVDFTSYTLKEGSALFIAKNQVQYFTNDLKKAEGICIIFDSFFEDKSYYLSKNLKLNRLFNYHIETPLLHSKEMGKDTLINIAQQMYVEYHFSNTFAKSEMLNAMLQILLLKAERAKEYRSISGIKNQWLETFSSFKNLLETDYVNTRNSKEYASKLFISYKFLNDIVKRLTGKTAKTFIDDFVTMEIKRYLISTSLSVKEISYKTGFEEPANMVKFFKKNTNFTPLKFRQAE